MIQKCELLSQKLYRYAFAVFIPSSDSVLHGIVPDGMKA